MENWCKSLRVSQNPEGGFYSDPELVAVILFCVKIYLVLDFIQRPKLIYKLPIDGCAKVWCTASEVSDLTTKTIVRVPNRIIVC